MNKIIKTILLSFFFIISLILYLVYNYYNYDKSPIREPEISVIMPVYNAEKYLSKSIPDILNQTYKNFELICINDGSTDKSLKKLKEFAKQNRNIRIYSQRNKGAGSARNKGLALSRGKYVIFLDSDDSFENRMLEIMYNKAIETQSDIVICDSIVYVNNKILDTISRSIDKNLLPEKDIFNRNDFNWILNFTQGQAWDKLYRKDFIINNHIKFLNLRNTNDVYFTFLSLILANKITTVDEKLVKYNFENSDSISKNRNKYPLCPIISFYKLKKILEMKNIYKELEQSYINAYVCIMYYQYKSLTKEKKIYFKNQLLKHFPDINIENYGENYFIYNINYFNYLSIFNSNEN